jgi:hypothetical protein
MTSSYDRYCQWCAQHGQAPPPPEWWAWAVAQPRQVTPPQSDDDFDRETERREGWTHNSR